MADVLPIQWDHVYQNAAGEQRLVVSVGQDGLNAVAIWRTADPHLASGAKAQGSASIASFQKWAVAMRKANEADWGAFQQVERNREWAKRDARAMSRIKRSLARSDE